MLKLITILFAGLLAAISSPSRAQEADAHSDGFHLVDTWNLGGDGPWDYLKFDAPTHTLYIARLTRIMVVDTSTGKLVKEIPGLLHAHGVALDDKGLFGYITDGGANQVLVFDRHTYEIVARIDAGKNPDSIVFEPTQERLFAFNGYSKSATVIDAKTNKVITTLNLPGRPEFSTTDGTGTVFVNIEEPVFIVRIDAASMKITATWPVPGCLAPSGMAIDAAHDRLFSACDNKKMAVVDAGTGKVIATPQLGEGPDALRFDRAHELIFSSNGESGDLTVVKQVSPTSYSVMQTFKTMPGARTLAYDPTNEHIYVVSAKLGPKRMPSKDNPRGRPAVVPGSFELLVYGH
jgi:YVTN family beta-propeller protein